MDPTKHTTPIDPLCSVLCCVVNILWSTIRSTVIQNLLIHQFLLADLLDVLNYQTD